MRKPNLMVRAYRFLKASYKHAANDFEKADRTTYNDRVHACSRCEFYDDDNNTCGLCGCPIATKASWKSEDCPQGKWKEN